MPYARAGLPGSIPSKPNPPHRVMRLHTWPALTRLPPDMVFDAARLCALLSIRPSGAPLLSILLGLPLSRIHELAQAMGLSGIEEVAPPTPERALPTDVDDPDTARATQATSLLGRLWNRLSTRVM